MKQKKSLASPLLWQDIGMLLFLASLLAACLIVALSAPSLLGQNLLMLLGLFFCALLMGYHAFYAATVSGGFLILAYTAYKLFGHYAQGTAIEPTAYAWPFVLLLLLGGLYTFMREHSAVENLNAVLRDQVEELTVMDPLTGLENLRSMNANLARLMALSKRNGTPMALLLVRVRYADELKKILSHRNYDILRQRVATIAQDLLRLEDRVYTIDDDASLGIICFCDAEGAKNVRNRLLDRYAAKEAFADITDRPLKIELRAAYLPYDAAFGEDAIGYFQKVENELQYDV